MSVLHITKDNFENEVTQSAVPVLLDFWAPWCGPCKMVGPVLDELAVEVADKAKICKINVDEEGELARAYSISSIPTLIVIKDGKPVQTAVGAKGKPELRAMLGV